MRARDLPTPRPQAAACAPPGGVGEVDRRRERVHGTALSARLSTEAATVRSAWTAMELIGWSVLIPLAIGTAVTGVVLALGTTWGLLRHYWVVSP